MKLSILTTLFAFMSVLTPSAPAADASPAKTETAIVGGGCFWCTEGAYKIVPGILKIVYCFKQRNDIYRRVFPA